MGETTEQPTNRTLTLTLTRLISVWLCNPLSISRIPSPEEMKRGGKEGIGTCLRTPFHVIGLILAITQEFLISCFCGHGLGSDLVPGIMFAGRGRWASAVVQPRALGRWVTWLLSECNFSGLDVTPHRLILCALVLQVFHSCL